MSAVKSITNALLSPRRNFLRRAETASRAVPFQTRSAPGVRPSNARSFLSLGLPIIIRLTVPYTLPIVGLCTNCLLGYFQTHHHGPGDGRVALRAWEFTRRPCKAVVSFFQVSQTSHGSAKDKRGNILIGLFLLAGRSMLSSSSNSNSG